MGPLVPPPTAETIGRRVTIRYRVGDLATDVVGHLESVGETLTVRHRDGHRVEVDPAAIVVWRVVPGQAEGPIR